jgi:hypothetical protein
VKFEKGLARKLIPKFIGPYQIIRNFGNSSFQIELPPNMRQRGVHDVFHASLLRIHVPNDDHRFPGRLECQLGISNEYQTNEWAVDRILNHYGRRSEAIFQILWKSGDKTWMPYDQTRRLTALPEYLEIQGVSDIKDLGYGTGSPPKHEEVLLSAGVSIWGFNKVVDFAEWSSTFILHLFHHPFENTSLSTMLTGEYNLNQIHRDFHAYNGVHPGLKRLNVASFVVLPPIGAPVGTLAGVIAAEQIQLFAVHNMRLNDPDLDVDFNPAGYRALADFMNKYDRPISGFFWSYWSEIEHRVKDPITDAGRPLVEFANVTEFMVRDADIRPRPMLRDGFVEVSKLWYDHIIEGEQRRVVAKQRNIRESQKTRENSAGLRIETAASRARVAQKRARDEEVFQEASKRRHQEAEEGEVRETPAPQPAPVVVPVGSHVVQAPLSSSTSTPNSTPTVIATASGWSPSSTIFGSSNAIASGSGYRSPSAAPSSFYVGSTSGSVAAMSPPGNLTPYTNSYNEDTLESEHNLLDANGLSALEFQNITDFQNFVEAQLDVNGDQPMSEPHHT